MLVNVIADIFKYQLVNTIVVLTCWSKFDQVSLSRELAKNGVLSTFTCDPGRLAETDGKRMQGVLHIPSPNSSLQKIKPEYLSSWNKWVVVSENFTQTITSVRYDSDILLINENFGKPRQLADKKVGNQEISIAKNNSIFIYDVFTHPGQGWSFHPWGAWTTHIGLQIVFQRNRILRRQNFKLYPLKIATPLGLYSEDWYNGTFIEYLLDMSMPERDSGVRINYIFSALIIELLNATEVVVPTMLWSTEVNNSSMMLELKYGRSDLGGGALRMMPERFEKLDYISCIWPFHVGFTYLAERQSSNNMFMEPFTVNVWYCCLALFFILALAQRLTAKSSMEKEGAYIAVLATFLQQDASAVPQGFSGRWTFLVLSVSAMLIHAYYTSAIVSALMSAGRDGPDTLEALGDSKYAIACEDYDYMRYLMFDVKTNWESLEYLKRKKMTSKFYQDIQTGARLIQTGQTAYHTEYNQLYPHLKTFTDDQLCKLQYVDTVPEVLTWVTATKNGQWTPTFKIAGAWLNEVGLAKRLVSRIRLKPPPCRAALLAERVTINDILPVLMLTFVAAVASLLLLGTEILVAKWKTMKTQ